jgi:hypothetical protein
VTKLSKLGKSSGFFFVQQFRMEALRDLWTGAGLNAVEGPGGNKNALKHGRYTREAIAERAHIRELVRQARKLHQAGIQRPDGFSSFASAPSARTAAVMNTSLAVSTSALSSLTLSELHARLGVIEKFNS